MFYSPYTTAMIANESRYSFYPFIVTSDTTESGLIKTADDKKEKKKKNYIEVT